MTARSQRRKRAADDRGAVLVLAAMLMGAVLALSAIVVDLGYLRTSAQLDQSIADFAALAAGESLGANDPVGACEEAIGYLNTNASGMPAISAVGFCTQAGNNVGQTACTSPYTAAQAAPTTTSGKYTISLHYPVPDSEITDPVYGIGVNDGIPCGRLRVIVTATESAFFGGVMGKSSYTASRSATITIGKSLKGRTPALWLLDPYGCTSLAVSGGGQLTIGATTPAIIPGVVAVDSDGSGCSGSQTTISVTGSGTLLKAIPTVATPPDPPAAINLMALPLGATTCVSPACDPADVAGGRITPQPVPAGKRATRAPVDWQFNCKTGYPAYHGIAIPDCPDAATIPPYVDRLVTAVGASGKPTGYTRWTTGGRSCNASGTIVVSGNFWVDCPGGLTIGTGTSVTFSDGNVVLDGGLSMSGSGVLNINTANATANLPAACLPPPAGTVTTPCIGSASAAASILYVRSGDINLTGGSLSVNHAMTYLATGVVKVTGGAPPVWLGPTEGPFAGLSLWAEASSNKFSLNGGASAQLSGSFFTPEAKPFSLAGGGNWGQQHAQFISFQLAISGGGIIGMAPDPVLAPHIPPNDTQLIR